MNILLYFIFGCLLFYIIGILGSYKAIQNFYKVRPFVKPEYFDIFMVFCPIINIVISIWLPMAFPNDDNDASKKTEKIKKFFKL